jgi:hypothetical protein
MSGGITQLVSVGALDEWISGTPQVSFFQSAYRRHTNFSQTVEKQLIQGNPNNNSMSTVKFDRKGDLLGYTYITGSNAPIWSDVVDYIELYIGGSLIDTQTSDFCLSAVDLLATSVSKSSIGVPTNKFYPLRFFFCESSISMLPIIALSNQEVEIRIYWKDVSSAGTIDVYSQYVYLDDGERKYFASNKLSMIITQTQKMTAIGSHTQELNFNHPVKYLMSGGNNKSQDGLTTNGNKAKLQINGIDVTDARPVNPNFTTVPLYYHAPYAQSSTDTIFFYPFCLDANKLQPSGHLNFSRIENARLVVEGPGSPTISNTIYAVNYNILKIHKGQAGVMFGN